MNESLIHRIAITCLPNIGDVTAKKLIAYCGSPEAVFQEKKNTLEKIPGIGSVYSNQITQNASTAIKIAEKELVFAQKNNIEILFYLEQEYPKRLLQCDDGPVILYKKGNMNLNATKIVSIVGTRNASDYGKTFCEQLINALSPHKPLIVSGLAYGIDICAHRNALQNQLPTVGVVAHGLNQIYPGAHSKTAKEMLQNGGMVSDFRHNTQPERENFPKRNRIVAGLSDLTIVVESGAKGGSMITAHLANDYNRDVFALPGNITNPYSRGCNQLIKTNKAFVLESIEDLEYIMNWTPQTIEDNKQPSLFSDANLTQEQQTILSVLVPHQKQAIDNIAMACKMPMSKTASLLLELEFENKVKAFPGKMYQLC